MTRLEKKCVVGSASLHGLLLIVFLFGSAFLGSAKKNDMPPVITLIANVTDKKISSGGSTTGSPTPPPPAPAPIVQPPAPPPTPEPPKPEPPKPVKLAEPEPPKPEPVKPKIKESTKPKIVEKEPIKEHGDFAVRKPTAKDNKKDKEKDTSESPPKKSIKELSRKIVRTNDYAQIERDKQARLAKEAKDRADREYAKQVAAYNRDREAFRDKVNGVVGGVGKELTSHTVVEPLGDGAAAYINYGLYIRETYDRAWTEPPSLTDEEGIVKARITIARNGQVVSARIVGRSGNSALDRSVQRALDSVRIIPKPFPSDSKDSERTFTIDFNLKAKRMSA